METPQQRAQQQRRHSESKRRRRRRKKNGLIVQLHRNQAQEKVHECIPLIKASLRLTSGQMSLQHTLLQRQITRRGSEKMVQDKKCWILILHISILLESSRVSLDTVWMVFWNVFIFKCTTTYNNNNNNNSNLLQIVFSICQKLWAKVSYWLYIRLYEHKKVNILGVGDYCKKKKIHVEFFVIC